MILKRGDFSLYEPSQSAKRMLRGGTALLLALLLCGAVGAGAAEMTDTRMLVPVGHTVGIKLFPVASWWSSSPKEELQPKPADSRLETLL